MRKLILTFFLFAISFGLLTAQTSRGNLMLGASTVFNIVGNNTDVMGLGFTTVKYKSNAANYNEPEPDKTTSFNFSPKVGYFVIDNLALGLNLDYFWSRNRDGQTESKSTTVVFGAGPMIRYYIPTSRVIPYAELNAGFGTMKDTYESDAYDNIVKSNIVNIGVGAGMAVPLSEKFTFDVLVAYSSTTIKERDDNPDNFRTVLGTVGVKLGFTYFIGSGSN